MTILFTLSIALRYKDTHSFYWQIKDFYIFLVCIADSLSDKWDRREPLITGKKDLWSDF